MQRLPRELIMCIFEQMSFVDIVKYYRQFDYLKTIIESKYLKGEYGLKTAIDTNDLYMFDFIHEKERHRITSMEEISITHEVCKAGNLNLIKWVHYNTNMSFANNCVDNCVVKASVETIDWLIKNTLTKPTKQASNIAAKYSRIDILEYLHVNGHPVFGKTTMNNAAMYNQLECIKWLHINRPEGCTEAAMNYAASHGYLDIVCWLNENRKEGCTEYAMNKAAENGHLEVVKYLHYNTPATCTTDAIDRAAEFGYLETVKFLFTNRNEGCTDCAINYAAISNQLDVVKWLYTNTNSRPYTFLERVLASKGLTEMIDFMYNNGLIKLTLETMYIAIECNQWDLVRYFKKNEDYMDLVYTYSDMDIIRIIRELN